MKDDASALTNISAARKQLEELARFDEKFLEALAALESAKAAIEDVSATARDYADGIDASTRAFGGSGRPAGAAGPAETQVRQDRR